MAFASRAAYADRKIIVASSLGALFEWYDFFLYGALAAMTYVPVAELMVELFPARLRLRPDGSAACCLRGVRIWLLPPATSTPVSGIRSLLPSSRW